MQCALKNFLFRLLFLVQCKMACANTTFPFRYRPNSIAHMLTKGYSLIHSDSLPVYILFAIYVPQLDIYICQTCASHKKYAQHKFQWTKNTSKITNFCISDFHQISTERRPEKIIFSFIQFIFLCPWLLPRKYAFSAEFTWEKCEWNSSFLCIALIYLQYGRIYSQFPYVINSLLLLRLSFQCGFVKP